MLELICKTENGESTPRILEKKVLVVKVMFWKKRGRGWGAYVSVHGASWGKKA